MSRKPSTLLLLSTIVLAGLSGCQSMPFTESLAQVAESLGFTSNPETGNIEVVEEPHLALSAELNQFISLAKPGEAKTLQQTPWGSNTQVIAGNFYTAASGRRCRILQMDAIQNRIGGNNHLVCEKSQENWVTVRPISYQN